MITLTPLQREALIDVIGAKLNLWDLSTKAEQVLDRDIDTVGDKLDYLCSGLDTIEDARKLSDSALIDCFGLNRR